MLFMFIPTFCPDECPLVVLKSEGCWGQLNHQNMRAELEDWWERYCWRGKFQKTSQGARHVWWGGRTSPYAGLRRSLKESYRCPVITCDHIWWHYCNKYSRKLPFLQPEMASSVFFSTAENSLFWGSARTRDIPRQGMVLGRKKNPAGQSQMHPNVLKCIIHEIQYNSIPIGWNSCICPILLWSCASSMSAQMGCSSAGISCWLGLGELERSQRGVGWPKCRRSWSRIYKWNGMDTAWPIWPNRRRVSRYIQILCWEFFEQICVKYMDGGAGASYKHAKHHMPAIQEFKVDWELAGVRCWQSRWGREVVDWT